MLEYIGQVRDVKLIKELARQCAGDVRLFEELVNIFVKGNERERKMSSWALSTSVEYNPAVLKDSQHNMLLKVLESESSGTVVRNIIRTWQFAIPESMDLKSKIVEFTLEKFFNAENETAIRAFAITVLEKYILLFPELANEVVFQLEKELPHAGSAYTVRALKYLKKYQKLISES